MPLLALLTLKVREGGHLCLTQLFCSCKMHAANLQVISFVVLRIDLDLRCWRHDSLMAVLC